MRLTRTSATTCPVAMLKCYGISIKAVKTAPLLQYCGFIIQGVRGDNSFIGLIFYSKVAGVVFDK